MTTGRRRRDTGIGSLESGGEAPDPIHVTYCEHCISRIQTSSPSNSHAGSGQTSTAGHAQASPPYDGDPMGSLVHVLQGSASPLSGSGSPS